MTSTIGGFKSRAIESVRKVEPGTFQYIGKYRHGQDVFATSFASLVASDATEAGTTASVIVATSHSAKSGDLIQFTSGTVNTDTVFVQEVTTNSITLSQTLDAVPGVGSTFSILRPTTPRVSTSGAISISGPVDQGAALSLGNLGWLFSEVGFFGLPNYYWNILGILEIPTVVIGDPISGVPWSFLNNAGAIHGSAAHDAADNNNPVKIGGRAITDGKTWPSAVSATNDRTDAFFDTQGFQHIKDHGQTDGGTDLTALNVTFNNVTTTASSADVTTLGYRTADFYFAIASGGVGTHYVTITVNGKIGSNYFSSRCGYLGKLIYEDTATATKQYIHLRFPCPDADAMRITITATNTTAVLTFTIENAHLRLST